METLLKVQIAPKSVAKNESLSFLATANTFLQPTKLFVQDRKANKVVETITSASTDWSGLFLTPNAAGKEKPDDWIVTREQSTRVV